MFQTVGPNISADDISLVFCSCCLKKFSPHPSEIRSDKIYMFLPTIDPFMREHFAYVEVPKSVIEFAYSSKKTTNFNLGKIGNVLHVEIGACPTEERAKEIIEFYSRIEASNDNHMTFYC